MLVSNAQAIAKNDRLDIQPVVGVLMGQNESSAQAYSSR